MGDERRPRSRSRDRDRKYSRSPRRRDGSSPPRRSRYDDDRSPSPRRDRKKSASRSPSRRNDRGRRSPPRDRGYGDFGGSRGGRDGGRRGGGRGGGRRPRYQDDDDYSSKQRWGKAEDMPDEEDKEPEKEPEPDFGLSGALAAETNTVNGVVLVYNEPPEARPPTTKWRLYVFKNGQPFGDPLYIHKQSRYLFGRERRVADIPTDHPSCSQQHAVVQFRLTEKENADGMMVPAVRPYLMDLGSTNGSYLNGERIEPQRYYELLEKDMLKFGNSTREYVLLKEK